MKKVTMTTTTQQHCFFIVETRWPESRVDMVHVSSAGLNSGDVTPLGVHQLCLLGDHVRDNNLLPPFAMFLEKQLCRPQQGTLAGAAEEWDRREDWHKSKPSKKPWDLGALDSMHLSKCRVPYLYEGI